jgi:hypothetical protein
MHWEIFVVPRQCVNKVSSHRLLKTLQRHEFNAGYVRHFVDHTKPCMNGIAICKVPMTTLPPERVSVFVCPWGIEIGFVHFYGIIKFPYKGGHKCCQLGLAAKLRNLAIFIFITRLWKLWLRREVQATKTGREVARLLRNSGARRQQNAHLTWFLPFPLLKHSNFLEFNVLAVASMKIKALKDSAPCNFETDRRFRGALSPRRS